MRITAILLTATIASSGVGSAESAQVGADRTAGIAFQSGTDHSTLAVECAVRRGRVDILTRDSAPPVLLNGINLASVGVRGDYYLFDSTSFVLVRPGSKTFAVFATVDVAYNFNNGREGWPVMFDFPAIRAQPVSAAEGAKRQLERHGAFQIYWHVDVDWDLPRFAVPSRGRLGVADAPLGESTVVRWFGPALALAQMATIDSTWFPIPGSGSPPLHRSSGITGRPRTLAQSNGSNSFASPPSTLRDSRCRTTTRQSRSPVV
jgi:hypothetical protein